MSFVKMRWFQSHSFFDSLRPVYLATKIFHLHFETVDFKQRTVRRTLGDQFGFIVTVLVDFYLLIRSTGVNRVYLQLTDSVLLNVGWYVSLELLILFTSTLPLWNRYKTNGVFEMCENIADCDRQLETLGIAIDHRKHYIVSTVFVSAWTCISVFILIKVTLARFNESWMDISSVLHNTLTLLAIFRTSSSFSLFACYTSLTLMAIRERFSKIRDAMLRHLETETAAVPRRSPEPGQVFDSIRRIASVHDLLSDTIQLFNDCYSAHLVQSLTPLALFTIFAYFGLIHAYASNADEVTMRAVWNNIMYNVFFLTVILQLVAYASLVGSDCKQMVIMIHKAICYGTLERRSVDELRFFSQQLDHHAPKISCGLFDLDWPLFYSIIGSFTTYLVILLQFDFGNWHFIR